MMNSETIGPDVVEGAGDRRLYQRRAGAPSVVPRELTASWFSLYIAGQMLLALAAQESEIISTVWALSILVLGLIALTKQQSIEQISMVVFYIVGAELIWRGTGARVFWEYGKYTVILLLGIEIFRRLSRQMDWRAIVFAACLAPSMMVLPYFDRQDVAFNLSGPVALAICTLFFFESPVGRKLFAKIVVISLGPIAGLASLATFGTIRANPESLTLGSKATTAGIGPNQVSSMLGLGVFFVFVLFLIGPKNRRFRGILVFLGLWFFGQMLLSFSRGGLWTCAGAILVASFYAMRDRRSRGVLLSVAVSGFLILRYLVLPATDSLTRGGVSDRFSSMDLTGREKIMKADWIVFRENPLFGVGPGQSYGAHAMTFRASSSHTEYTRLLAEHGSFGVVAILMLGLITWRRFRMKETPENKGVALALTIWALLYMGHSAMRLAAPAVLFGLGGASLMLGTVRMPKLPRFVRPATWRSRGPFR